MNLKLSANIEALEASATEELDNAVKRMRRAGIGDIISLGVGEPEFDTPPNIVRAAQYGLDSGQTRYQPTAGDYELRIEICKKLQLENQIEASVEDVIVTPGAKFAIYLAAQAILEPGDQVIVLDPSWVSHSSIPKIMGAEVKRIICPESNGFQPDINQVREQMSGAVKLLIFNSPCNPTGAVFDKDLIRSITELARENNSLVLSDEIYENIIFEGEHYSPGSEYNNVITVNGFSKKYAMTGWRLGYATGPQEILDGMIKIYQHSVSCVTAFAQSGAVEALRSEESQFAANEMVQAYRSKRKLMMEYLERSDFFKCEIAQGAFYCFPSYNFPKPSIEVANDLLNEVHVATVPGVAFGSSGENHLRLSYVSSQEDLAEAFNRIEGYFNSRV
jgi:aspartate aminotransferase